MNFMDQVYLNVGYTVIVMISTILSDAIAGIDAH